jgi:predicted dehydrogenase
MNPNRRNFLAGATAGLLITKPETAFGYQANSALEIGILGCGGRGEYVGNYFREYTGARVVALHDPFQARIDSVTAKLRAEGAAKFAGIDGYKKLLEQKLDAVLVMSPPIFHPDQALDAVNAGKHVYVAKPIAVDVPGCRKFQNAGDKAKASGKTFWVDFQMRISPPFVEAAKRVHAGEIGTPTLGHVYYHAGRLDPKQKPGMTADQARLANWVFDKVLSGDIIVEQNIHVIDIANWYFQAKPEKAFGACGRKVRVDVGDCNDHFMVQFWYPNGAKVDFSSAQFTKGYDDLCIRVYGSKGTVDSHYQGFVRITGDKPWAGTGEAKDPTGKSGTVTNIKSFFESVKAGSAINNAADSVQSTLTCIMGRMAAYSEKMVTWDEMMNSGEELKYKLTI